MGKPKLLLPIGGKPMVRRTAEIALSVCSPLIVVTGCGREGVEGALASLEAVALIHNEAWNEGMVRSAIAGLGALPRGVPGFFLHHGDMPFVSADAFSLLARAADLREKEGAAALALVASRSGHSGHPVYFPISYAPAILALAGGERLKSVLDRLGSILIETGCDGVLEDIDSREDYETLLAKYGQGAGLAL
jgi:molybdenum cofactor cytidylyltransferase